MMISAIEAQMPSMRPSERLVGKFVLGRPSVVIHMSIADFAEGAEVSEPTIIRFCRAVGCMGFIEFKLALARDLERRTFTMNRTNPSVKGPAGFGQALFSRVVANLEGRGDGLPLDKIDDILEWCAVARAITIVHDGSETWLASPLVEALLSCRLEANAQSDLVVRGRKDGRVVIALRSTLTLTGFEDFCRDVIDHEGKIVLLGFDSARHSLALSGGSGTRTVATGFGEHIIYAALAETLRLGIEARLSRTGSFVDAATDLLQSQREIAYGDARRRDRQSAQTHEDAKIRSNYEARTRAQQRETT
jgi:RpiR family transcriptional regulator, carbohydrate utilization regulator